MVFPLKNDRLYLLFTGSGKAMTDQETKEFAVNVIRQELGAHKANIKRILLFGSHARESAPPDSDWDFFIVTGREMAFPEKLKAVTAIQRKLAERHISIDIVLKSEEKVRQESGNTGLITYYALKEGVAV